MPKAKGQKPLFPFGYGLSYTTFELKNLRADKQEMTADGQLTFTVDVTNTGNYAGSEVVQLYISDMQASVPRPVKELKGFSKVFLQPRETRAVSITIDSTALSFYDDKLGQWTTEPGEFEATVAQDGGGLKAKSQKLKAKFVLR